MGNKYAITNEEQLKNELGITNWNQLSKEKFITYLRLIPNTDPEIIKLTIKELPKFVDLAKNAMSSIKEVGNEALKGNKENLANFNKQCDIVLQSLKECLNDGELSFDEKKYIIDQMGKVLQLAGDKDKENKNFLLKVLSIVCTFVVIVIAGILSVVGIKVDAGKHNKIWCSIKQLFSWHIKLTKKPCIFTRFLSDFWSRNSDYLFMNFLIYSFFCRWPYRQILP